MQGLRAVGASDYCDGMKQFATALITVFALSSLSTCGLVDRISGKTANAGAGSAEPAPQIALSATPGAKSAAALDLTTDAEKAAATAAPADPAARSLGSVVVALGSPAEQGFWLRSALVTAPGKGRVTIASGASVAVDLEPGSGAALLSLAAYRALGLGLTELPDVKVFADQG